MTSINIGLVLTVSYILLFCCFTTASPHGLRLTFEEHAAALATGETEHVTHPQEHDTCDKRLCASIVSYCLIQEACDCDTSDNCSCCHECAICLGDKFGDCSDCVGIKEKSNYSSLATDHHLRAETSISGIIETPLPILFKKWTDSRYPANKYAIFRYPNVEQLTSNVRNHHRHHNRADSQNVLKRRFTLYDYEFALQQVDTEESSNMICTAVYFDNCMSLGDCKVSCSNIGANMFRWFEETGCCACFGSACSLSDDDTTRPRCRMCLH